MYFKYIFYSVIFYSVIFYSIYSSLMNNILYYIYNIIQYIIYKI